ncbi:IS1182 family transposase [Neolewinella sp.]|uniref:IS1182 family transposase n=1 Tax=Neolewinella sp. TaxID=2993543 RepID=UPI003B529EA9
MPQKTGFDPAQIGLFAVPLEAMVAADAEVRVIAAFVDQLDLPALGFAAVRSDGASAYGAALLLKLYLYGYLNRERSSRRLARCCRLNVEMMWLTGGLQPKYHTIADFRKDYPKQLKALFRQYVLLLKDWSLVGGQRLAIDGTKVRAQNSTKRNFNAAKLKRNLERIEAGITAALEEFARRDEQEGEDKTGGRQERQQRTLERLASLRQRKAERQEQQRLLSQSKESQLSLTDADARSLLVKGTESMVGYNVQSVVDGAEYKLIVHLEATNVPDAQALSDLVKTTAELLDLPPDGTTQVLADKGYHSGSQLAAVEAQGMVPFVAERRVSTWGQRSSKVYGAEEFSYDEQLDVYHCPAGQQLTTPGVWYDRTDSSRRHRHYSLPAEVCRACSLFESCVSTPAQGQRRGRTLSRSEYAGAAERNRQRLKDHPEVYPQRQALVEHPFGTLKRSWGGYFTLVKGLDKVDGEFSLLACCYSLRRSLSILGVPALLELLRGGLFVKNTLNRSIEDAFSVIMRPLSAISDRLTLQHRMWRIAA